jgi:CheY-like chemotaxis protein
LPTEEKPPPRSRERTGRSDDDRHLHAAHARFESIRIFHEHAPAIPLIAMSGYAFANLNAPAPDFLRMALELGAARCLRKPFTPDALFAAIEDCLAAHRAVSAIGLAR